MSSTALTIVSHQRIVSYPKKGYPNLNRVFKVFWPSFFRHMNFSLKREHRGCLRFTIPGEWCTMVLVHFKSLHQFLKVARRCFFFLDECCTLHHRCCTLWIPFLRTAITVASFRVTGAINSQNEGLGEFYGFDGCKPSTDSFIPKKRLSEPQSGL